MKALVISDDEKLVKECTAILEGNNYDVIAYKWLLKALDNIEEIRPNLIVVSSSEYPRHWKTLVQFVKSGIGGDDVAIYLYEPTPLSKEDLDKANVLGINGYFTQPDELGGVLSGEADVVPSVDELMSSEVVSTGSTSEGTGHILITNPDNNSFLTGRVTSYSPKTICASLDFNTNLKPGCAIQKASYIWNGDIKSFSAVVENIEGKNITLSIENYYEEE